MTPRPDHHKEVPQEAPSGHEVPERTPGEPTGPEGPAPPRGPGRARTTFGDHLPYGTGLVILLALLGWLTFEGAHPNLGLLAYVAVLGILYRLAATHPGLTRRARENLVFALLGLGLLGLLGMLSDWSNTYLVFVLTTMVIYAIFALGLNLEFGHTGIINFGHVAFMGIGAYTMAILSLRILDHAPVLARPGAPALLVVGLTMSLAFLAGALAAGVAAERLPQSHRTGRQRRRVTLFVSLTGGLLAALLVFLVLPYPLTPVWAASAVVIGAALVGMGLAGAGGVLLGLPSLRLRADYLAIVTIGAAEILRRVWRNEREVTGGPSGLTQLPRPFTSAAHDWTWLEATATFLDVRDPSRVLLLIMAIVVLLLVVSTFWILLRSPYGRVLKAIREDEEVATALGKNVFRYKLQALAIGSMVAALAGSLLAWHRLFISPNTFIPLITFYAWIIIVVGGVGNNKGTMLGAVILFTFFEATRSLDLDTSLDLSGPQGAALRIVVIGVLLVLLMLFKPEGILGRREEMVLGD